MMTGLNPPYFDLKQYRKLTNNIYLDSNLDWDTPILRYTDLNEIFCLLKEDKFRLSKRKQYSDRWEQGADDLRSLDKFHAIGTPVDKRKMSDNAELRKGYAELLSTCFTLESDENYCMWKSYAPTDMGVRYTSTVGDFLNNIDTGDYTVYVGAMDYFKYDMGVNNPKFLFTKNVCYSTEREVRFYFFRNDGVVVGDDYVFITGQKHDI